MKTLSNNEFKIYLNSLRVENDVCGNTMLNDENQTVCEINLDNSTHDLKYVVTIDDDDYRLTASQIDLLYNMAYDEAESKKRHELIYS